MTYLYNENDQGHYTDDFWPTVDPYRLPGITVDTQERDDLPGWQSTTPDTKWVGGAELDDEFGIAGMQLEAEKSSLSGKKSWILLDDMVLALGTDISSSDDRPVETVIENRNLHEGGTNTFTADSQAEPTSSNWSRTYDDANWAHLEGVGGYLFPGENSVSALREDRTGRWQEINPASTPEDYPASTRRYQTLLFDHGSKPDRETYAYALLPNATVEQTRNRSEETDCEIVSNNSKVQSVSVPRLSLIAANFWEGGTVNLSTEDEDDDREDDDREDDDREDDDREDDDREDDDREDDDREDDDREDDDREDDDREDDDREDDDREDDDREDDDREDDGSMKKIQVSGPASVVMERQSHKMTIAVSDPTRTQESIVVEIDEKMNSVIETEDTVTVTQLEPKTALEFNVGGSEGQTHTATLTKNSSS